MWWQAVDDIAANLFAWLISAKGGDVIGVAVLLVIGVATLIRWHRRQRAAKKLGMASLPFIALCFAVALLAVAGGAYSLGLRFSDKAPDARTDTTTVQPGSQLPPPSQPTKPPKNYFPAEKIELGNLLSGIASKLNNEGLTAAAEGYRYSGGQFASREELLENSNRVLQTMLLVEALRRGIWDDIILKNPRYEHELNQIVSPARSGMNPINSFTAPLEAYKRELDLLSNKWGGLDEETRRWISSDLIGNFANNVHASSDDFKGWIQLCNNRIDDMREALR
ncbi:MAG TPA: hypothetical protein VK749_01905 [Xanthobacteraceae bacterium]|jgi:hypothetical protein|nr:hypothetical protein [Xanthobacteraceae bacterium]